MGFEELKQRQAIVWGSAPFENIAVQLANIHDHLVRELEPQPGERWLDVATGTGEVAFRAAEAGAEVTASDLAPALIETAKRLGAERGLEIDFHVADCERLPYDDASFDVVSSAVGVMFSPDHRAAAGELARVCRPGGRIGLTNWKAETGVHDMFKVMAPFQPAPPPGVGSPFDWGREEHVRELLGDAFDLEARRREVPSESAQVSSWDEALEQSRRLRALAGALSPERLADLRARVETHLAYWANEPASYVIVVGRRRGVVASQS